MAYFSSCNTSGFNINPQYLYGLKKIPELGYIFINDTFTVDDDDNKFLPYMDKNWSPTIDKTDGGIRTKDNLNLRNIIRDELGKYLVEYSKTLYYLNSNTEVSREEVTLLQIIFMYNNFFNRNENPVDAPNFNNSRAIIIPYRQIGMNAYYNIFLEAYNTRPNEDGNKIPIGSGLCLIVCGPADGSEGDFTIVENSVSYYKNPVTTPQVSNFIFGYNWDGTNDQGLLYEVPWKNNFTGSFLINHPDQKVMSCKKPNDSYGDAYQFTCFGYTDGENTFSDTQLNLNMMVTDEEQKTNLSTIGVNANHPSHRDHPQKQATHEQHLENIKKSDDKLALGLGLGLGLGLPILIVVIYFIYKYRMK